MHARWLLLIFALAACWLGWWAGHNPLPDGFQNEYLHVGNAYDLWAALQAFDVWHLRWYMYTGYWPWGFYALPWPALAVAGPDRVALLSANLVHLGVLLIAMRSLGRTLGAPLAPVLVVLCPGVFGGLVRFEPNLADIAWVAAGVAALVASRGLRSRRHVVAWGVSLGLGLMFDRLTVAFFLLPAVVPLLPGAGRRGWKNLGLAVGLSLVITGAYYREFFGRHAGELLGQAPVGEIDAAGQLTVTGGVVPWLYYPLSLIDTQAGPVIGFLMLLGVGAAAREVWSKRRAGLGGPKAVVLASVLGPLIFFSLVAKKQVFYTLPVLGPLAALAACRGRIAWLGVAVGAWTFGVLGVGLLPGRGVVVEWLPDRWVAPRHTLAEPPSFERWPLDEAIAAMPDERATGMAVGAAGPGQQGPAVLALSLDDRLFEGFLALAIRERRPGAQVRGVITDPNGTYELLEDQQALLLATPAGGGWPTRAALNRELLAVGYAIGQLPPVAKVVAEAAADFEETARFPAGDLDLVVFERAAASEERP
ncbi:MAG: hypothetical protein VX265_03240 [Myxococcota bacterium]|nr:hypothetical protein [Myxococcota bacterium]